MALSGMRPEAVLPLDLGDMAIRLVGAPWNLQGGDLHRLQLGRDRLGQETAYRAGFGQSGDHRAPMPNR